MAKKSKDALLYDGAYYLTVEFTDELKHTAGKFISPYKDKPGRVLINPSQPEFDMDVALQHEINHYIAWQCDFKWSESRVEAHAQGLVRLLRNSPWLRRHWCKRNE